MTAARWAWCSTASSETAVYNVLPQWAKLAAKPKTMFIGGPVKRDAALCLAALRVGADPQGVPGLRHVAGRMVMVDLDAEPDLIAPLVEGVRIFAGYSGWTIGQLEGEIERDDWIVLSALPSDVLVGPRVRPVGPGPASPAAAAFVACHPPDRRQPKLGLLPASALAQPAPPLNAPMNRQPLARAFWLRHEVGVAGTFSGTTACTWRSCRRSWPRRFPA